ncbi:MAG: epoxyqueuosine reductase [Clostridioides sp.]|nr:epoxyqueuosine reductase [Clostridioides sp.]
MKDKIESIISSYVDEFSRRNNVKTRWKSPIVGFAAVNDPLFNELKSAVGPEHMIPIDFSPNAKTVISYFLPFENSIPESNDNGKRESSEEWVIAYIETNKLLSELSSHLFEEIEKLGYECYDYPVKYVFDKVNDISNWSQRHIAYIAGVGTFGLNNMMITKDGCCGRLGSVVTSMDISPTSRASVESCLFKRNGTCKLCVDRCVAEALHPDSGFERFACDKICNENSQRYSYLGNFDGCCGKCLVGMPCSTRAPF